MIDSACSVPLAIDARVLVEPPVEAPRKQPAVNRPHAIVL